QKGLSDLARVGLLYEELESPGRQDSAIRYAIVSQEQVGCGPTTQADGRLAVLLLDGCYAVDPIRLITRRGVEEIDTSHACRQNGEGVEETYTPPEGGKNGRGMEETHTRGVRNVVQWVAVSSIPSSAQAKQEAARTVPIDKDKIDTRDKR